MSDRNERVRLVGPDGKEMVLACWVNVGSVYKSATCVAWREDGGRHVGLTFVLEPAGPGAAGLGVSFTAEAVEVLYRMMKRAVE